ncbi:MAG: SDR family NAD(P)-dependent oxidoreductase [Rikenellaceae bacterium]
MKKSALITGASSGIGQATARILAQAGYNLVLTARRAINIRELKREIEATFPECEVLSLSFDIRDKLQCEAALENLPEEFRTIDLLINNAGLAAGFEHISQGDTNDWDAMIDTNIKGLLYVSKIISNKMIDQGYGHIINIGSIAGVQPYENGTVYCASKHAVHALSQGMRIDLLEHGIKVTEIRPGMVETEFSLVRFQGDLERAKQVYEGIEPLCADDIADTILWVSEQPEHVNINEIEIMPTYQANSFYTHRKQ